jgi:hypothetical protein
MQDDIKPHQHSSKDEDRPALSKISSGTKKVLVIGVITVVIALGLVYWFAIKPVLIRNDCNKGAVKYAVSYGNFSQILYSEYYNECIEVKGLSGTTPTSYPVPVD